MAYTPETADQGGYGSEQSYNNAMGQYGGAVKHYRKYEDKMRRRVESRQAAQDAMQKREQERRASVWSNMGLMFTGIGSAFGPIGAAVGGLAGSALGMGIAAARGGNPFDLSAQFEYMDMGLLGSAATGVAGAMMAQKKKNDKGQQDQKGNRDMQTVMPGGPSGHGTMGVTLPPTASAPGSYEQFGPGAQAHSQKLSDRLKRTGLA
jgi:hypothetical protein